MKTNEEYMTEINLADFVQGYGFQRDLSDSKRDIVMKDYDGSGNRINTLIIRHNAANGQFFYTNRHDDSDRGNIFNFIKNHVTSDIKEVYKILDAYSPGIVSSSQHIEVKPQSKVKPKPESYRNQFVAPLDNTRYLVGERQLDERLVFSKMFQNRVLQSVNKRSTESGKHFSFNSAVVFPLFDQNGLMGLEEKSTKVGGQRGCKTLKGSIKEKAVWRSNVVDENSDLTLIVGEQPIDMMSYHEINRPTNPLYAATCGAFGEPKIDTLQRLVDKYKIDKIVAACDNDVAGVINNINIIGGVKPYSHEYRAFSVHAGKTNTLDKNKEQVSFGFVDIKIPQGSTHDRDLFALQKFKGQLPLISDFDWRLQKYEGFSKVTAKFPYDLEHFKLVEKVILNTYQGEEKTNFRASQYANSKDWNDDLKEIKSKNKQQNLTR